MNADALALTLEPAGASAPLRRFPGRRSQHTVAYRASEMRQGFCGVDFARTLARQPPTFSHVFIRFAERRRFLRRMILPPQPGRV